MTTNDIPAGGPAGLEDPRLVPGERGPDLILSRSFAVGVDEVWATLTDPARTTVWFGPWEGEGASGATIRVQMSFEDGDPWVPVRIDACDRPTRLAVSMLEDQGDWRLAVVLAETALSTRLSLIHHLTGVDGLGEIGPGWESYLDLFEAALLGGPGADRPVPSFSDYYPARAAVFTALAESYVSAPPEP
ncbi:SRPBCC domain-containing protein [Cryobacterium sp. 1639]|uniref:SRPBCC domain-containing protein n=1 Tax=Cryobacterium inferilacus TaxID=2866629 RepID=UPI001C739D85|nr:SRPBCC domain-containing protein [Cryobacterium sp. 1639]MBX0300362.1 SRPBCC domain-containing protein [Cryobacterium sp. 1639]